ncbi:hypothetical protein PVL29_024240 [Vitis rotundifolia]|uniref:VQ domain-containing protein n=1 Tax=Vitis rotundifolia TaxID=103349 RepID=A0AA38YRG5_VITRO|nr:hypothetical protein PVL29_024240 [Vitis rotundifolia]
MDSADFSGCKSPRRELLGPRPTPLKVRKDSHKIRKPPVVPQPQAQHPPPVIIYTVSPKIIHTQPSEFMTLVQRLTGLSSSSSSSAPLDSGAVSPAARFASIEKTKVSAEEEKKKKKMQSSGDVDVVEGIEIGGGVERSGFFPGILSPGPSSLPAISPNFFSPGFDPYSLNIFHDFSPAVHGNKNYIEGSFMPSPFGNKSLIEGNFMPSPSIFGNKSLIEGSFMPSPSIFGNKSLIEGSFMPSPSTFLSTPHNPSPTASLDLFNNFLDF